MLLFLREEKIHSYLPSELFDLNTYKKTLLSIILFSALFVKGQDELRFQNISVADGLSMGTITAFERDSTGFMWIATAEGLHRYDGTNFKVFKHSTSDLSSLTDSYIRCLKVIGNHLFIGTNNGTVDVLDLSNYKTKHLYPSEVDPQFDFPVISFEMFRNNVIIGTEGGGLWTYSLQHEKLARMSLGHSINATVPDLSVYNDRLYYSIDDTLFATDLHSRALLLTAPVSRINAFAINDLGVYLGGVGGVYFSSHSYSNVLTVPLPERKRRVKVINDITLKGRAIWIGTEGGLVKYEGDRMSYYEVDQTKPNSLISNQVNTIFIDSDNNVWLGTMTGVSKYSPSLQKFQLIQYYEFNGETFNNNTYYIYSAKDDNIWLGTLTGGMIKLNEDHEIIDVFPVVKDGKRESRAVRCIYEDSKGNFWVGTRDEGLFLFNEVERSFKHIKGSDGSSLNSSIVRDIYEDSNGQLWIGTQNGLNLYDHDSKVFRSYVAEPKYPANNSIYQISEDPKTGNLILASFRGGIQIFNPNTERFISLKHHVNDSTSIGNNNVMCMTWIADDSLLIGTYGGGMDILDIRSKTAVHITEEQGLVNNAVYGILYNGNGEAWVSTNNGICRYNIYSRDVVAFRTEHYLQNTEFNEGAFTKSNNGYFYFGGVSGFNYFKPNEIAYDTDEPPLLITEIRGDYSLDKGEVVLRFLNSRLELDFTTLYYAHPDGVKYRYRMLGYDQSWLEPTFSNTAIYPRLSPGSYTFEVQAEDEFGKWKTELVQLKVYVIPPFWQRWWFITLIVLVLILIVLAVFRLRTREIERTYKHQLLDSELRALRSQMNPHFIFNSLNSIQYFILKKQPQEAYTYLSKFASLMRKILQNSRLKYISIKDEVEWLELYLEMEKLRMDDMLDFEIDHEGVPKIDQVHIPTMLIQPFVENGIIHGLLPKENDRKILIRFTQFQDHVECIVQDNGIGRKAASLMNEKRTRKHDSAGMALTKTRLKILSEGKGDFDVTIDDLSENGKPTGTRVRILIPVIEATDE